MSRHCERMVWSVATVMEPSHVILLFPCLLHKPINNQTNLVGLPGLPQTAHPALASTVGFRRQSEDIPTCDKAIKEIKHPSWTSVAHVASKRNVHHG